MCEGDCLSPRLGGDFPQHFHHWAASEATVHPCVWVAAMAAAVISSKVVLEGMSCQLGIFHQALMVPCSQGSWLTSLHLPSATNLGLREEIRNEAALETSKAGC